MRDLEEGTGTSGAWSKQENSPNSLFPTAAAFTSSPIGRQGENNVVCLREGASGRLHVVSSLEGMKAKHRWQMSEEMFTAVLCQALVG